METSQSPVNKGTPDGSKPISREQDLPDITNPNFRVQRFSGWISQSLFSEKSQWNKANLQIGLEKYFLDFRK